MGPKIGGQCGYTSGTCRAKGRLFWMVELGLAGPRGSDIILLVQACEK